MNKKKMSQIIDCNATNCAYNRNKKCHAFAITVGDEEPCCDTFCTKGKQGGFQETYGGVGACKVTDCIYNDHLECSAQGIHVVFNQNQADCTTFKHR